MSSLWKNTINLKRFDRLEGDKKTDVLIIGGGFCGILTAYSLKKAGVSCILVEADRVCGGTSANTTAKITAQHGVIYKKITDKYGPGAAKLYYKANSEAIEKYRALGADIEYKDAYVYSKHDLSILEEEYRAALKAGAKARFMTHTPLPFGTVGAIRFLNQAQCNPLSIASKLINDLDIYENTRITELAPHTAKHEKGMIHADKIIVATHFPILNKHGAFFLKLYQHRSYVLALENAQDVNGMFVDANTNGYSFRNYGRFLLLGGGSHKTGKKGGGIDELRDFAKKYYPDAIERYAWAAQDCMSLDGIPYIGRYSDKVDGLYVATGFNKWGMSSSMVASQILTDMVLGKKNEYEELYSPSRGMLCTRLFANCAGSVLNLITPTVPRCPHLGCALKYNRAEKSWDCPCHGSRFHENGALIEGPATKGLKS